MGLKKIWQAEGLSAHVYKYVCMYVCMYIWLYKRNAMQYWGTLMTYAHNPFERIRCIVNESWIAGRKRHLNHPVRFPSRGLSEGCHSCH